MKAPFPNQSKYEPALLAAWIGILATVNLASATVRYVNVNNASPAPPYTNWTAAAVTIQQAVDAAAAGDEIVVTNGVYATGGRAIYGKMTNRVAVDKPLTLRSVNGPQFTVIQGRQVPGTTNGDGAIRCVYMTNGATLSGFTLTNGATRKWPEAWDNRERSGGGAWCESTNATVSNCVIVGSSAESEGGGAYTGTFNHCALANNSARYGGGAEQCTLNNCRLKGNSADYGGGALYSTLDNCALTGNAAGNGGGAYGSKLRNCTLTGNHATSHDVDSGGGGASSCALNNCIVYFNTAALGANHHKAEMNYCCTTPLPSDGTNNITLDPQLASASHISAASPCRGTGSAAFARGTDIDGEAWANPPAIGCDEYRAGTVTGPLSVAIVAALTNVAAGFPVSLTALIEGRPTSSVWSFGDGATTTNQPFTTHAWTTPGDYVVVLRAFNESHPDGVSAALTVRVGPPVHFVAADSANPMPPYTSWATAATNIQAAVDAATVGALVLVSNGVYANGGRAIYGAMTNRVAVTKPLLVRSVNGPAFTIIQGRQVPGTTNGDGAIRCVYLTNGASLSGFTLTNGATRSSGDYILEQNGGGAWGESMAAIVSNCVVTGNSALDSGGGAYGSTLNNCTLTGNSTEAGEGGGANYCTLNNCALTGNSASYGGGASWSTLNNCTITGNRATSPYLGGGGGGAYSCWLNNCIIYFNTALAGENYLSGNLNYCCTTPLPTRGRGNITFDPQLASASHLSAASPCRGAGSAEYTIGRDIDGEAWADPPSIGCDEFQAGPAAGLLRVSIAASFTNVAAGFIVRFNGSILGRAVSNVWDFGDGTIVQSDRFFPSASHCWASPGTYPVVLRAFNQTNPAGISATVTVQVVVAPVHYVAATSSNPVAPYTSWATAATTIQAAVDAFGPGTVPGALVLVTNGTYATGGSVGGDAEWSRVALGHPLALRSVNGPRCTAIDGGGSGHCVSLTSDASLSGFTLTNGGAGYGGGLFCESTTATVSNCLLVNNWAWEGGGAYGGTLEACTLTGNSAVNFGGGAARSTLFNCTLTSNTAQYFGGGAYLGELEKSTLTGNSASTGGGASGWELCNRLDGCWGGEQVSLKNCTLRGNTAEFGGGAAHSILNNCVLAGNTALGAGGGAWAGELKNCTLTGNSAGGFGGGVSRGTLDNCIVYFNTAPGFPNHQYVRMIHSCTTPLPEDWQGIGNITNEPEFVNSAAGDFHLRHDSPCIDAGTNLSTFLTHDLDGNLRPLDGDGDGLAIFDIGAYEFDRRSCMPVLTAQPQSQTINEGGTATFTVAADGLMPFLYQWRFNGADISAATNTWLTLTGVQTSQAGLYSVRVTNDCGEAVSSNAFLRVNRLPVADASATPTLVISGNGLDAHVGLDGSRSSDPEGDPLKYLWLSTLNAQTSTQLATGLVAVVTLPIGTIPVQLVVSDGFASSTNTITVTVLTTGQAVQRLIILAGASNLQHPQPLVATLEAALASLKRGDLVAAANQLRAFQNKVRTQAAPENPSLADALLVAAQQVIDALDGRNTRTGGRFHSVRHQPDGRVRLKFTGTPGGVHVVQASTNLLDWETIGVAVDHGDGQFEFEDAQARRFPTRFYRRISP